MPFEHYKPQNFEKVSELRDREKWRIMSNVRFQDLKKRVKLPDSTAHICTVCRSSSFQVLEVRPPRSKKVGVKLVVSCLNCGNWFNLDKYTYR